MMESTIHWLVEDEGLDIIGMCLVALAAFVVAWRSDRMWHPMCCTWIGLVALPGLTTLIKRSISENPTISDGTAFAVLEFVVIGWFPGFLIFVLVATLKLAGRLVYSLFARLRKS
jgi:TRAP-type C4-dicarboxylate transport system permease small subunit